MTEFARERMAELLRRATEPPSPQRRGRALEDLIVYLFESVPGITLGLRNAFNPSGAEEIDVIFWNERRSNGLYFSPYTILVECKNWSKPVDSAEIAWFDHKVRSRGQEFGVLIASNGITGDATSRNFGQSIIRYALGQGRRLVVVTRLELEQLDSPGALVELLRSKEMMLAALGTSIV